MVSDRGPNHRPRGSGTSGRACLRSTHRINSTSIICHVSRSSATACHKACAPIHVEPCAVIGPVPTMEVHERTLPIGLYSEAALHMNRTDAGICCLDFRAPVFSNLDACEAPSKEMIRQPRPCAREAPILGLLRNAYAVAHHTTSRSKKKGNKSKREYKPSRFIYSCCVLVYSCLLFLLSRPTPGKPRHRRPFRCRRRPAVLAWVGLSGFGPGVSPLAQQVTQSAAGRRPQAVPPSGS